MIAFSNKYINHCITDTNICRRSTKLFRKVEDKTETL